MKKEVKKSIKYPIENVYYVLNNGIIQAVLKCGEQYLYFSEIYRRPKNVLGPLKDELINNNLGILFLGTDGNVKNKFSKYEIQTMVDVLNIIKNKSSFDLRKNEEISQILVNMTSDLLGFNASCYPSSKLDLKKFNIEDIALEAKKLKLFKETLFELVKVSFMLERNVILVNEKEVIDYRLIKALNAAGITRSEALRNNEFKLYGNINGELRINDESLNEKGFQKIIKL